MALGLPMTRVVLLSMSSKSSRNSWLVSRVSHTLHRAASVESELPAKAHVTALRGRRWREGVALLT